MYDMNGLEPCSPTAAPSSSCGRESSSPRGPKTDISASLMRHPLWCPSPPMGRTYRTLVAYTTNTYISRTSTRTYVCTVEYIYEFMYTYIHTVIIKTSLYINLASSYIHTYSHILIIKCSPKTPPVSIWLPPWGSISLWKKNSIISSLRNAL